MNWLIFDTAAEEYEAWYSTPTGKRADRSERSLLRWLLGKAPGSASILEIGCGTGHFTFMFGEYGLFAVGLDRAPAMVATAKRLQPRLPVVLGDANSLPFGDRSFDIVAFIATLEFLEHPAAALADAVRVSRRGLIVLALNKWSVGRFSRRWGKQARGQKLSKAHDYSLPQLVELVRTSASDRVAGLWWRSALLPLGPAELLAPVPLGDVIGLVATLREMSPVAGPDNVPG